MLKEYVSKQIVTSIVHIILAFFGLFSIFLFLDINLGISPLRDFIFIEYADDLEGVDLLSLMGRAIAWHNYIFFPLAALLASIVSYWTSPRGKEIWCAVTAIIVGLSIWHAIFLAGLLPIKTGEIIRDFLCIMIAVVTSTLVKRLRQSRWDMPET